MEDFRPTRSSFSHFNHGLYRIGGWQKLNRDFDLLIVLQLILSVLQGFEIWKEADLSDKTGSFGKSRDEFKQAAQFFFDEASGRMSAVGRALFEYSTLMDAFSAVQDGRRLKSETDFDAALARFARASEILRATVHFAFLSSYVSACASLETAMEFGSNDDALQGFRNGIALFEQSKLALSFRDERHPLVRSMDALIKYSISKALLVEADILNRTGSVAEAKTKTKQASTVRRDLLELDASRQRTVKDKSLPAFRVNYFPLDDWIRATRGAFLATFHEIGQMWIGNIGINSAFVESLGGEKLGGAIGPGESFFYPMNELMKGKIRISYRDLDTNVIYDEGCGMII